MSYIFFAPGQLRITLIFSNFILQSYKAIDYTVSYLT
jgi:hypothetical protein